MNEDLSLTMCGTVAIQGIFDEEWFPRDTHPKTHSRIK